MINYLEHHIVDHCNLNCIGCSHFSPLAEPWFEDIRDFERDFRELKNKTDVGTIRIMGGEPLLHPDCTQFLIKARELFPDSEIQLVTNGILLKAKKSSLVDLCNNLNIVICISNYGLFNQATFNYMLDGFKFVRIDGKTNLYNISLDLEGNQDKEVSFDNCDLHIYHWYYFQNGRFYPCCISANTQHFDKYFEKSISEDIDNISISIYEHSIEEIEEFLNTPIPLCRYCDTIKRAHTYTPFCRSNKEITEWTCQ